MTSPATHVAEAEVKTASGSRYLQQLCKHWGHNLQVEFDAAKGSVRFPKDARGASWAGDSLLLMTARPESLLVRIEASEAAQLEAMKGVVARHLDRFAFREAPLDFRWQAVSQPSGQ